MEVYRQLADIYGETGEFELKERHVDNNTMEIVDNTSAVCCSECYSEIECKQYYRFACGHAYHMECW